MQLVEARNAHEGGGVFLGDWRRRVGGGLSTRESPYSYALAVFIQITLIQHSTSEQCILDYYEHVRIYDLLVHLLQFVSGKSKKIGVAAEDNSNQLHLRKQPKNIALTLH